jgi:hypothetical protein
MTGKRKSKICGQKMLGAGNQIFLLTRLHGREAGGVIRRGS